MRRLLLTLFVCLTACASDDLTEVVVHIDAEPGIAARANALGLYVYRDDRDDPVREIERIAWSPGKPYRVAFSPKSGDGKDQTFLVQAEALQGEQTLAVTSIVTGYVPGQTVFVLLRFEDACLGNVSCDDDATCHQGQCIDASVAPSQLARSAESARPAAVLAAGGGGGTVGTPTTPGSGGGTPDAGVPVPDASTPRDSGPAADDWDDWDLEDEDDYSGGACEDCLATRCQRELLACVNVVACESLIDCAAECTSSACLSSCYASYPSAKASYESVLTCGRNQCLAACGAEL